MVDPREPIESLTDRELLILVYERCDTTAKCYADLETRMRKVESFMQQSIGIMTACGGGAGAIAATIVGLVLKFVG